ncbi:hypothetical protein [Flavobacterium sp.]|uniref:hypothetical protein n=1 Tax=Flavobacterium sp. TaxID=239 RepID=UPI0039E7040B
MCQKYAFHHKLRYGMKPTQTTMQEQFKISVPEPCPEKWENMAPKSNGRFCNNCSKCVVDFTKMSNPQIQQYFIAHQNKSICGRFETQQLDRLVISIPRQVLHSQMSFSRMFLLALFVAMGTTLFSCSDRNGEKRAIDAVEIVVDSSANEDLLGKPVLGNIGADTVAQPSCDKTDEFVYGMVIPEKKMPKIKVYKDSITMSESNY